MTDNIMPREYLRTLLPRLAEDLPGLRIFYEQKSNLSWNDVQILRQAGVHVIQPGIEALSTSLLGLMKKGVQARQNLMLLRYGRVAGIQLVWNLICGFPGDELKAYTETLDLVSLIPHLPPPSGLWHLSIDRFSPYHVHPESYQIKNVRPVPVYSDIFPNHSDIRKIAYHFVGDYECATQTHIELIRELNHRVKLWKTRAQSGETDRPELKLCRRNGVLWLVDTRGLADTETLRQTDETEARLLMSAGAYQRTEPERSAVQRKLAVVVDNWFVPLPVATEELFVDLSEEAHDVSQSPAASA
jgi:hypothetical protein